MREANYQKSSKLGSSTHGQYRGGHDENHCVGSTKEAERFDQRSWKASSKAEMLEVVVKGLLQDQECDKN
jgi:hypothetical protein